MSKNFNSHRRNDLYVPPFRKFQSSGFSDDLGPQHSGRRYDNFGGPSGHTNVGNMGGGRRFEGVRTDYHQNGPVRFDPYKGKSNRGNRNRRSRINRNNQNRNDYGPTFMEHMWYKITIPHGKRWGRAWILNAINEIVEGPFHPFGFTEINAGFHFFVDSFELANTIRAKNKCIVTPDGSKMGIVVNRSAPPFTTLNTEVLEKLKICMSNRFNPETNVLNLSEFQKDADLRREGIFLPLTRPNVFDSVVKVINENIPQLLGLDLSGNRLTHLNCISALIKCKNLKSLSLKNNHIPALSELNRIKGMPIEELVLDENPVCDSYKDQATYISAIREKFPKVTKLDGQDLLPPIVFDLGINEVVPAFKGSFFPSVDSQQLVVHFLESYYAIYDSESRQGLLDAYHENALYSLCTHRITAKGSGSHQNQTCGRNLLRGPEESSRHIKVGKLEIVAYLSKLPQSTHDPKSMTVDVAHVSGTLMMFNVLGVFKEVSSDDSPKSLRNFSRAFTVAPAGDKGIAIINDMHYVGNATSEQVKAFKASASKEIVSTAATDRNKLALQVSEMTGMNLPFSIKCLEENNWDVPQALAVFNQLKVDGVIPPEAFGK